MDDGVQYNAEVHSQHLMYSAIRVRAYSVIFLIAHYHYLGRL